MDPYKVPPVQPETAPVATAAYAAPPPQPQPVTGYAAPQPVPTPAPYAAPAPGVEATNPENLAVAQPGAPSAPVVYALAPGAPQYVAVPGGYAAASAYAAPAPGYAVPPPAGQPQVAYDPKAYAANAPQPMEMPPAAAPGFVYVTPPPAAPKAAEGNCGFSTGLCSCCAGPGGFPGCLIAWLVPCWAHGIIGDAVGDGVGRIPPFSFTGALYTAFVITQCCVEVCGGFVLLFQLPLCVSIIVVNTLGRKKFREKYGIPGSVVPDCCTVYWCGCCALAQELRHMRDNMPGKEPLELFESKAPTRTDLSFLKRATTPFF